MPPAPLLVTGFGPFAGLADNPSGRIAAALDGAEIDGTVVVGRVLPVAIRTVPALIPDLVAEHRPAAMLCLGVAIGASSVRVETTALNRAELRVADAEGVAVRQPLAPDGPAARVATWNADAVVAAIRGVGVPAVTSHHAGTHLCNVALYTALGALPPANPCGFLHLPLLPQQVVAIMAAPADPARPAPLPPTDLPSMDEALQRRAVVAALQAMRRAVSS